MEIERDLYSNSGLQAVDKKGRVAIPNRLRDPLLANSKVRDGQVERFLMIGDDVDYPCVVAYDRPWQQLLRARLEADYATARAQGLDIARTRDALVNFANVDTVQFDEAGRFILPTYVVDDLEIDGFAYFAGIGDAFQIWNPQTLLTTETVPERTKRRCIHAMREKGLAV